MEERQMKFRTRCLSIIMAVALLFSVSMFASAENLVPPIDLAPALLSNEQGATITPIGLEYELKLGSYAVGANLTYGSAYANFKTDLSKNTHLYLDMGDMDGNLTVKIYNGAASADTLIKEVTITPADANKVTKTDLGLTTSGDFAVEVYYTCDAAHINGRNIIRSLVFASADYSTAKVEAIGIDPTKIEPPVGGEQAVKITADKWAFDQQFVAEGKGEVYPADVSYVVCSTVLENIDLSKYTYLYVDLKELGAIANIDVSIDGATFTPASNFAVGSTGMRKIYIGGLIKDSKVVDELLVRVALVEDATQSKTNKFGGLYLSNAAFDPETDIPEFKEETEPSETQPETKPTTKPGDSGKPATGYAFPMAVIACAAVSGLALVLASKKVRK